MIPIWYDVPSLNPLMHEIYKKKKKVPRIPITEDQKLLHLCRVSVSQISDADRRFLIYTDIYLFTLIRLLFFFFKKKKEMGNWRQKDVQLISIIVDLPEMHNRDVCWLGAKSINPKRWSVEGIWSQVDEKKF